MLNKKTQILFLKFFDCCPLILAEGRVTTIPLALNVGQNNLDTA
jgi:hypothetical protein